MDTTSMCTIQFHDMAFMTGSAPWPPPASAFSLYHLSDHSSHVKGLVQAHPYLGHTWVTPVHTSRVTQTSACSTRPSPALSATLPEHNPTRSTSRFTPGHALILLSRSCCNPSRTLQRPSAAPPRRCTPFTTTLTSDPHAPPVDRNQAYGQARRSISNLDTL